MSNAIGTVLVVDDDSSFLAYFRTALDRSDVNVLAAAGGAEGLQMVTQHRPDLVVLDVRMPGRNGMELLCAMQQIDRRMPIVIMTGFYNPEDAMQAMKLGAYSYVTKPSDDEELCACVESALVAARVMRDPARQAGSGDGHDSTAAPAGDARVADGVLGPTSHHAPLTTHDSPLTTHQAHVFVGQCAAMQKVYKAIGQAAPHDLTVLIMGESGRGKELVARAIYQHSRRATGPFVAMNCAAIQESLLESELFGHERGAFTGAVRQHIGKFEQCSGGTLFLDEVGDMSPMTQGKLLRVLEQQRFERVGGNEPVQADVRLIAATNHDLRRLVAARQFREDLFHRLSVIEINLPPLRERPDDLPLLVEHFLSRFDGELGKRVRTTILPQTLHILKQYPWPGNVRELQSVLKRAVLEANNVPVLMPEHLSGPVWPNDTPARRASEGPPPTPTRSVSEGPSGDPDACAPNAENHAGGGDACNGPVTFPDCDAFILQRMDAGSCQLHAEFLDKAERQLITRVLQQTHGNQHQAAKILGIGRAKLRSRMRAFGITADPAPRQ